MADEVDVANEYYEKMLRSSIEACEDGELHIDGSGKCLWCGDVVVSVKGVVGRWCSIECREDMVKYG